MITKFNLFEAVRNQSRKGKDDYGNYVQKKEIAKDNNEYMGEINYRYYDDGVVVFMGSFTDEKYRGRGVFKMLFTNLLDRLPKGTNVYVPLSSMGKKMIPMFNNLGFDETQEPLRYWGKPVNSINMKKII